MLRKKQPEVGLWYRDLDAGHQFEVVAIDDVSGMIETQFVEGEQEEYEQTSWYKLNLQIIEGPEFWSRDCDYGSTDYEDSDHFDSEETPEPWYGSFHNLTDDGLDAEW